MKNSSVFGLLMNPFIRIAGLQAFGLGLIFLTLIGILGTLSGLAFDGVLDMHFIKLTTKQSFEYLAIDTICLVVVMWITALIVSKNFRFIDILGTMTLAKAPFLIMAFAGLFATAPESSAIINDPKIILQYPSFMVLLILSVPVMIWSVVLMHNALKVSCGLNGTKLTLAFIAALLASEVLSKIAIYKIV